MGNNVGIRNFRNHIILKFFKIKVYFLNSKKLKQKIKLRKFYLNIFGIYIFNNKENFENSLEDKNQIHVINLQPWINYMRVRQKNICNCGIDFRYKKNVDCYCGKPNKWVKVDIKKYFRGNRN